MPNALGNYSLISFAQKALKVLKNRNGMSQRVYRDYEADVTGKNAVINLRRPPTFVAQDAPSTKQDINTGTEAVTLDRWKEVKFPLSDKEDSTSDSDVLIDDAITGAVNAIGHEMDTYLQDFFLKVPYYVIPTAAALAFDDLAAVRESLFSRGVPMDDGLLYGQVDGAMERKIISMLGAPINNGAGVDGARVRGAIGEIAGINWWANQNTKSFTTNQMTDVAGVAAATAVGSTTLSVSGVDAAGAILKGDTFSIAGHTRRYTVLANATASSGVAALQIFPKLEAATAGSEVVTFHKMTGAKVINGAFHRNAFGLVTAPLSTRGRELGAKIEVVTDAEARLAMRARMYYDGDESEVHVALDVLYGGVVLDERMAVRLYSY